jgi:hypothetical protein
MAILKTLITVVVVIIFLIILASVLLASAAANQFGFASTLFNGYEVTGQWSGAPAAVVNVKMSILPVTNGAYGAVSNSATAAVGTGSLTITTWDGTHAFAANTQYGVELQGLDTNGNVVVTVGPTTFTS